MSCRLVTASKGLLVVFWKVEQEKYVPLASPDQYLKTPSVSTPLSQPTSLNEVSKGWYSCFCLLQPWEACPPSTWARTSGLTRPSPRGSWLVFQETLAPASLCSTQLSLQQMHWHFLCIAHSALSLSHPAGPHKCPQYHKVWVELVLWVCCVLPETFSVCAAWKWSFPTHWPLYLSSCPITSCPSLVIYMCVLSLLAGCKLTLARTMCSMHSSQSLMWGFDHNKHSINIYWTESR